MHDYFLPALPDFWWQQNIHLRAIIREGWTIWENREIVLYLSPNSKQIPDFFKERRVSEPHFSSPLIWQVQGLVISCRISGDSCLCSNSHLKFCFSRFSGSRSVIIKIICFKYQDKSQARVKTSYRKHQVLQYPEPCVIKHFWGESIAHMFTFINTV